MNKLKSILKLCTLTLAAVLTSACALPGLGGSIEGGENITIAMQSSTETQIVGYIVEGMIEHYIDTDAQIVNNLGTSTMSHQAMMNNDANITALKYTGTSLTGELGMDPITDPELALETVVDQFDERFNQTWFPSYGFANTYAFMVSQELADEYGIETISDLEPFASELSAGVDNSWIAREGDGYQAFLDTYQFDFAEVVPMQIGLVYDALQAGEMDVVLGYSTDGRIASYDLIVLEDDKQLFPPYDGSPVVSQQLLAEYPELENVLLKLEGTISSEQMQEMNYTADNNLIEPLVVATQFLEENDYFEDKEPYVEPANKGGQ